MNGVEALRAANSGFARLLGLVTDADWTRPTPCSEWDIRALVNHVVGANRRYVMLLHGVSTAEVEATRTVDHLGDDPVGAFRSTASELDGAFAAPGVLDLVAHHVIGDKTGAELVGMKVADVTVHTWDLARALAVDDTLDPDAVVYCLTDLGVHSDGDSDAASAQSRLLQHFGRTEGDPR